MSGAGWHFIGDEEEQLVLEVLRSRSLSRYRGVNNVQTKTEQLEQALADRAKVTRALATNSCTSALFLGLSSLGIGSGDEVLVPGYTFVATIASIIHVGATPVLVEIDESLTMDPEDAARRITSRTKAILVVHMLGTPANLDALGALADANGLHLIEDVAQACGGSYHGKSLGGFGCFGAFSFNVFKVITSGDGGALVTNDEMLADRAFSLHDHGFIRHEGGSIDGNEVFGYNMRMHELAAAVGLAQLRKLDVILKHVRSQKALLESTIGPLTGFIRRKLNDPQGECGTTLVYLADDVQRAQKVARALGTTTLSGSVKHDYRSIRQLQALSSSAFSPGQLPKTDDILERSLGIAVGVKDCYLGFGFGLDVMDPPEAIDAIAHRIRSEAAK